MVIFCGGECFSFSAADAESLFGLLSKKDIFTEHGKRLVDFLNRQSIKIPSKLYDVTQLHYLINQNSKHDLISICDEYLGRSVPNLDKNQADIESGDLSQQVAQRLKSTVEVGESY